MAQIRAHDDQGLVISPHTVQGSGHVRGLCLTHDQGHEPEVVQGLLQEREVDLQAVLGGVCIVPAAHERKFLERQNRSKVQLDGTQGSQKVLRGARCQAAECHVMTGTEENHPSDLVCPGGEGGVGGRRDRTGVDVAGMRRDQRLRSSEGADGRRASGAFGKSGSEGGRPRGIEGPRNSGPANPPAIESMGADVHRPAPRFGST